MCFFCKCDRTVAATTAHVVSFDNCVIIVKNVPCEECEQCGEKYFSDEVMERLEFIVKQAKELASEVFVIDYKKKVA